MKIRPGFFGFRLLPVIALATVLLAVPATSFGGVFISVGIAPPALPVYVQPICPGPGYIWTPGYWAYGPDGYYWVPGTWVIAPYVGALWTPGYWGWSGGVYIWHAGYWGPHIGFYGGVNYGFGYTGVGYVGGYWHNGVFAYNRTVSHVDVTVVHNTYSRTVVNNTSVSRVSYNGGTGGTAAQPNHAELAAARDRHMPATAVQTQHARTASTNRAQLASVNHGNPSVTASARPGAFSNRGGPAASHAAPAHTATAPSRGNVATHSNVQASRPSPAHAQTASRAPVQHSAPTHTQTASRTPSRATSPAAHQSAPRTQTASRAPAHAQSAPHGGGGHH